jgi:hypothetical protein
MNISKPKLVGWYQELAHGDPKGPKLASSIRHRSTPDEKNIAKYLANGWLAAEVMDIDTVDVLSTSSKKIGPLRFLTDGVWAWPSDLPFFLLKYHVELPEDFVSYMRDQDWLPRDVSKEEASQVGRSILGAFEKS